jgi:hypothetical protein
MLEQLDITAEQAAGLDELAALDLALAKDFARRAMAEEDARVAADLARTYQRMARSYRQSLALKLRLKRELTRAAADAPPAPRDEVRIRQRKDDLRTAIQRVIWSEYERPDWDTDGDVAWDFGRLESELSGLARRDPAFTEPDLDTQVVTLCAKLDFRLDLARQWRTLPPVPPGWPPEDDDSS